MNIREIKTLLEDRGYKVRLSKKAALSNHHVVSPNDRNWQLDTRGLHLFYDYLVSFETAAVELDRGWRRSKPDGRKDERPLPVKVRAS